jgi:hypothetical protein
MVNIHVRYNLADGRGNLRRRPARGASHQDISDLVDAVTWVVLNRRVDRGEDKRRRRERANLLGDTAHDGPTAKHLHFVADLLDSQQRQVQLIDEHALGQVNVLDVSLAHAPGAAHGTAIETDQLDIDPATILALPDVPGHEHPLSPANAIDAANLVNAVARDRGAVVKRRRLLGHHPDIDSRVPDDGRIRVTPTEEQAKLCGTQKEKRTKAQYCEQ